MALSGSSGYFADTAQTVSRPTATIPPGATLPRPPTIAAFEALRFLSWLSRRGAHLPALQGVGPENRLPIQVIFDLWAAAIEQTGDRWVGVRFGLDTGLEDLGLLGLAMLASPDLSSAFERLVRFQHLASESGRWELSPRGQELAVVWHREGPRTLGHASANESVLAMVIGGGRKLLGAEGLSPRAVRLRHEVPAALQGELGALMGCEVSFGQPRDEILLPLSALSQPVRSGHAALGAYFDRVLPELPSPPAALTARGLIEAALADGEPSAQRIARRMAMSERTLRRALAEEGTSFRALLDEVRKARAALLLEREGTGLTEIAFLLGFSELSAFSRAHRRWFGVPPSRRRT